MGQLHAQLAGGTGTAKEKGLTSMIDDATTRSLLRFGRAKSAEKNLRLLERWLRNHGRMVSCYTEKPGSRRGNSTRVPRPAAAQAIPGWRLNHVFRQCTRA